jgi:integrase
MIYWFQNRDMPLVRRPPQCRSLVATASQREKQSVPQKQGLGLGSEVLGRRRTKGCWHHFVRLQRRIEDLYIAFCTSGRSLSTFSAAPGRTIHSRPRARTSEPGEKKRIGAVAGIHAPIGNHTFRATGITAYLSNGGALEHAQEMAAHESPRTTKLYDRTKERLTQDEVERIRL